LIELSAGFVVLEGKAGTLAELAFLWALQRAGCLGTRPVVLLGDSYRAVIPVLERSMILEPEQLKITRLVASEDDVLRAIDRATGRGGTNR
jgi:predicted Rossmann-fold nucleotide-binding protein